MKKVLVIEDDDFKISDLAVYFSKCDTTFAKSVRDGIVAVTNSFFDLIVLDMSLPTFKKTKRTGSGSSQAQGGLEILREVKAGRIQTPLVIVSQYPDIELEGKNIPLEESPDILTERYDANIKGAVIYDADGTRWAKKFETILSEKCDF